MNILGYDLQESVVFIIHIIATIGGAVVGWFVCDPLTRVSYWIAKRASTPGALLFCVKAVGALSLATAVWFLMPAGDGKGPGPGPGGGFPSKGAGGDKSGAADLAKYSKADLKDKIDPKDKSAQKLEPVEIEIISGKLFEKLYKEGAAEPYFRIQRAEPALTVAELEAYLKKNHARIEVTPVLTKDSIGIGRKDNPLSQLLELTKKYSVKTLQYKTSG